MYKLELWKGKVPFLREKSFRIQCFDVQPKEWTWLSIACKNRGYTHLNLDTSSVIDGLKSRLGSEEADSTIRESVELSVDLSIVSVEVSELLVVELLFLFVDEDLDGSVVLSGVRAVETGLRGSWLHEDFVFSVVQDNFQFL